MCGIAGIVLKKKGLDLKLKIRLMSESIDHRGPDGEGFFFQDAEMLPAYHHFSNYSRQDLRYIPKISLDQVPADAYLALAHRRLSIIDLSEAAHQPMCSHNGKIWITYNGEVYNYPELKQELKALGHDFRTDSDTEVIIASYIQWGRDCVKKFNGMWAFCIYDSEQQLLFASRDRLGVKPFYFIHNDDFFAFASEQKAFIRSGLLTARVNEQALHDYLLYARLETERANFFEGVEELLPGHSLLYQILEKDLGTSRYYSIEPNLSNNHLPDEQLIAEIRRKLESSVRLRLRSDVEVGTCLSGGIDSSVLAALMQRIHGREIYCFTSVFRGESFNEEPFADILASSIRSKHRKVEPGEEDFLKDIDELVYSQDVPIWDTSTYAQFSVMRLAKENGIKVVLDGQGADELFAGYQHHFVAKWNQMISAGKLKQAVQDIRISARSISHPFLFYGKEKLKQRTGLSLATRGFFSSGFVGSYSNDSGIEYFNTVNAQLLDDIQHVRLKAFLKCEDRCGMWHSVEARTPFSDDPELIDFMFSFDGSRKISGGVSKYLLREATKDILPPQIYSRYDKKGFETPALRWLQSILPRMLGEIGERRWSFVDHRKLARVNPENLKELRIVFRLFVLSRWQKVFNAAQA